MFFKNIKRLFKGRKAEDEKSKGEKVGIIKYFNWKKGFGFIRSSQTAKDVFVHIQDLNDRIRKGDRVQFQVEKNEKGLRAKNVELIQSQ